MKKLLLQSTLVIALSSTLFATSNYVNRQKGHYVTVSHLHYIFNKLKRTSDVSPKALAKTFNFYEKNRYKKHLSPDYIAIADYTKPAIQKRLYVINLHTGKVNQHLVSHGKNSGAKGGRVWRSSNKLGSNMTPYGFFKVGKREGVTYRKHYKYLSIQGLEWKNRNAKQRDILLHTANYVNWGGRSYGCFAIPPQDKWQVFSKLKRALLYSYTGR